jgi:putative transposase
MHVSDAKLLELMAEVGIHNTLYNEHTTKYSSFNGDKKTSPNILRGRFVAKIPYTVLHTDITQVKLLNGKFGYISSIMDEATREVIGMVVSDSPNKALVQATLDEAQSKLPKSATPIMHSDHGWHYQTPDYRKYLQANNYTMSMSRKGNCLDNAPMESFFHLMKIESLNRHKYHNLNELKTAVDQYTQWFNTTRISLKTNGKSPVEYRDELLTA